MSNDEFRFVLKQLSAAGVGEALGKAQRYRLLNEPGEAESICRDILEADATNHDARIALLLSITDQFERGLHGRFEEAKEMAESLDSDYERAYYHGIICERRAKAMYRQGGMGCGAAAYIWFRRAMDAFAQAEELCADGNDVALLRWNACARKIMSHEDIRPRPDHDDRATVQNE